MIYAFTLSVVAVVLLVAFAMIRRSQRYWRHQARLEAAFDRAQEVRIQRPQNLYGERAWSTLAGRRRKNEITLLR